MRIAQVCADRGIAPGSTKGAAQHLRGIAAGLTKLGHHVVTFSARRSESDFPVPVRGIDEFDVETAATFDVIYERYSLGHQHGLDTAVAAERRFVLEVNAPLVAEATEHRPSTLSAGATQTEARLLSEADLVTTVSPSLTQWARQYRTGPTLTLTNGFEPRWFSEPNRIKPRYDLVFIGHPKPWHGAARLPPLLPHLADRGVQATLLVIGGGPGADQLAATAKDLGVEAQLTITGPLPPAEATTLLADATIGIAPYPTHHNFYFCPLKIVDYLAAGLPIVSTAQGNVADLVGNAGIVVDSDDDTGLTNAVAELLADGDLRHRLGDHGRRRAWSSLTWDHVAARTAAAISEVCSTSTIRAM